MTAEQAGSVNGNRPQRYAHIIGWGMAVPERVMTNEELEALVSTDDAWIRARTGIEKRRIANERESTATLGLKASQNALNVAQHRPARAGPHHLLHFYSGECLSDIGEFNSGLVGCGRRRVLSI